MALVILPSISAAADTTMRLSDHLIWGTIRRPAAENTLQLRCSRQEALSWQRVRTQSCFKMPAFLENLGVSLMTSLLPVWSTRKE